MCELQGFGTESRKAASSVELDYLPLKDPDEIRLACISFCHLRDDTVLIKETWHSLVDWQT